MVQETLYIAQKLKVVSLKYDLFVYYSRTLAAARSYPHYVDGS